MTIQDDIFAVLDNDVDLGTLLTGGVHTDIAEITRQAAPGAFDANQEILPCALLKWGTDADLEPHHDGVMTTMRVYFYQRSGFDVIYPAMDRVYALLHRLPSGKIGSATWEIRLADNVRGQSDQALDCSLSMSTYQVWRRQI